ncbi:biotin/lipoyl-binding protein [Ruminiclostridium herbifermentans]|uniref:Biotin/lipoyl-binding protein n=1 Tax=Ruminiclostridium herbifermentans TaxID=2488810 RepID=A0A4U7JFD9_9FIRM|nr:biotin/lipoyl-containing protein [Ruminiclostridium herbifermentans]QNU67883.1 biotin/lipoyl-binding protein [Ruminiclostridium herbifermentans]
MRYIVTINNKNYEVEVERGQANIIKTTEVAPAVTPAPSAAISAPVPQPSPAPAAAVASVNGEPIKAPMPGLILNCKVNPGSKVKRGDVLFILEAMKMENEIVAPIDGTVVQILAAKGSSVSTGEILAVIQ